MKLSKLAFLLILCSTKLYAAENNFSVTTTYGPTYKEPNNVKNKSHEGTDIAAVRVSLNYRNTWQYGTNYISIGYTKENGHDPARGSTSGAEQASALYRGSLSLGKIFDTDVFKNIITKDVSLNLGGDYNTKNNNLSTRKKQYLLGASIAFNVPGYLNTALYYSQESNHNGVIGKYFSYEPNVKFEVNAMQPLTFTGLPLKIDSLLNIATPKGKDGFGRQTKTELLSVTRLILDAGDLVMSKPKVLDVFVGYQYWFNKYGSDNRIKTGAIEHTFLIGSELHF